MIEKNAPNWHLRWVLQDQEFIRDSEQFLLIDSRKSRAYELFLKKYALNNNAFRKILSHHLRNSPEGIKNINYKTQNDEIHIVMDSSVSKSQYLKAWKVIGDIKETFKILTKKSGRGPEYDQLLYAIFKARQKNTPYAKIFNLASDGRLEYYPKKFNKFLTPEILKNYYLKYRKELSSS